MIVSQHFRAFLLGLCLLLFGTAQQLQAQTFVFAQLNGSPMNTNGWTLSGNAFVGNLTTADNSELILTNSVTTQSGAIFYDQPIDALQCKKWIVEFDFRMFDGNSADGIAFCYLDVPPSGFVSGGGLGIPATADGLKICFDTYPNCSNPSSEMPKIEIRWGQGYDECWSQPTLFNNGNGDLSFIRSNTYNHAKVVYNDGNIDVYVNNTLYLQGFQQINFPGYMGFTASTGGLYDSHSIKNAVIYTEMPPSKAGPDVLMCKDGSVTIGAPATPGYLYSWSPALGLSNSQDAQPTLTLPNNTINLANYQYIVSTSLANAPGCFSYDTVVVSVLPKVINTPDFNLCQPATISLSAKPALSYQWSPSTGLSNPNAQNPTLNATVTQTYRLDATYYNTNLLANGDFEQGNTGFFTNYTYCNTGNCLYTLADNGYSVGTNANFYHTLFSGTDHTTGFGSFMMINGARPNLVVWRQTIAVEPNTNYAFGTWISSLININPASIQFSINGTALGPVFSAPASANQWVRYFTQWNSGANTNATIEIVDVFPQANGNDFGLDDIFFAPIITCSDTVRINVGNSSFNPLPDSIKACAGPVTLDAGPGYSTYNWSNGGSTQTTAVNSSGLNLVTVTSTAGCTLKDSSYVLVYPAAVSLQVSPVICAGQSFQLYNGNSVSASGQYRDTLKSVISGCDSIVRTVQLLVITPVVRNTLAAICSGQAYVLPSGNSVNSAGLYRDTLRSITGCDSIITNLQLSITTPVTRNVQATICQGQGYVLPSGQTINTTGLYRDTVKNLAGCDSVYTVVNLTVTVPQISNASAQICSGQTYTLPSGHQATASGVYRDTLRDVRGCDSAILNLTLVVQSAQIRNSIQRICPGNTFTLPSGLVVSTPGTYADTLKNLAGCDSIISRIILQFIPLDTTRQSITICIGQSHTLPSGLVVTSSGTYTSILSSVAGCDSTIITQISQRPRLQVNVSGNSTVCAGQPVTLTATASGGNGGPYSFNWVGQSNTTNQLQFTPTASGPIRVEVTDGCTSLPGVGNVLINLLPNPVVSFTMSPLQGCEPLLVNPVNNSTPATGNQYTWYWGDGTQDTGTSPAHIYTISGQYPVSLKATAINGCTDSVRFSPSIVVTKKPNAAFVYTPAPNLLGNSAIQFIDQSTDAVTRRWLFGDGESSALPQPKHVYGADGNFDVMLIADNGRNCSDTAFERILVKPLDDVYIPNAFTPNNDGVNDVFRVYGIGITVVQMDIYNRYGERIYTTSTNPPIWNGIDAKRGILHVTGNYVYMIQVKLKNGFSKTYRGNVLLLR